jgi:DNA-binding CsgD family transcriptional regulator
MRTEAIAMLAAIYDVGGDTDAWLGRITAAAARLAPASAPVATSIWEVGARGVAFTHVSRTTGAAPDGAIASIVKAGVPGGHGVVRVSAPALVGVIARASARRGVVLSFTLAAGARVARRDVRAWSRFAVHLGAALHLHDRVAGRLRRVADDEAAAIAGALARGEWTAIDRFDAGGRRFVIAIKNAPAGGRRGEALTAREAEAAALLARGHANKLIAYEMGRSPSTIAGLLATACEKLGVDSTLELAEVVRRRGVVISSDRGTAPRGAPYDPT